MLLFADIVGRIVHELIGGSPLLPMVRLVLGPGLSSDEGFKDAGATQPAHSLDRASITASQR